jgi:hypothetical protein
MNRLRQLVSIAVVLVVGLAGLVICGIIGRLDSVIRVLVPFSVFATPMIIGSLLVLKMFPEKDFRSVIIWAILFGVSISMGLLTALLLDPRIRMHSWQYTVTVVGVTGVAATLIVLFGTKFYSLILQKPK